jgi:hypothetical protein
VSEQNQCCETCRFGIRSPLGAGDLINCHRYAPRASMRGLIRLDKEEPGGEYDAHFPLLFGDEWCGEWEAKREAQE